MVGEANAEVLDLQQWLDRVVGNTAIGAGELDGAQGWYALRIKPGELYSLSLIANEVTYAASILGGGAGMMIIMR